MYHPIRATAIALVLLFVVTTVVQVPALSQDAKPADHRGSGR